MTGMMRTTSHQHTAGCTCNRTSHALLKYILMAAFLLLAVAAVYAQADAPAADPAGDDASQVTRPAGRILRLGYVEGDVRVMAPGDSDFSAAVANMPLAEGFQVETGGDGKAEIQFEDGSVARIAPGSVLALTMLHGTDAGDLTTRIDLNSGIGYFELYPQGNSTYTVHVQDIDITLPNEGSFRVDLTGSGPQVAVSNGGVAIATGSGNPMRVQAGQTAVLEDEAVTSSGGIEPGSFDQWNQDRDALLTQESANTTDTQQGSNQSGWSDLDYYGNYYAVPGVGQVWQPYGYDSSFDPYGEGYWANYGWGSTWISAYPWGWTPFHCGYWNYWPSFGWGWVGANCGIGDWYSDATINTAPPGYDRRRHRPHYPRPRPGDGTRRIVLTPVGRGNDVPYRPAPSHPAPHGGPMKPVTIGGRIAMPVVARPPSEGRAPGSPGSGIRFQHGPAAPRVPGTTLRGHYPPVSRGSAGGSSAPRSSLPAASSTHSESHPEPSHSDPPPKK